MKFLLGIFLAAVLGFSETTTAQQDTFNYRGTSGNDYGPNDWDDVSCNNLGTCVSCEVSTDAMATHVKFILNSIFHCCLSL
jgi:hypothetical protein